MKGMNFDKKVPVWGQIVPRWDKKSQFGGLFGPKLGKFTQTGSCPVGLFGPKLGKFTQTGSCPVGLFGPKLGKLPKVLNLDKSPELGKKLAGFYQNDAVFFEESDAFCIK
jgi:hypothetical protein